jgi:hypothetical protein
MFAQSTLVRHTTQAPVVVLQTSGVVAPGPGPGTVGVQSAFVEHAHVRVALHASSASQTCPADAAEQSAVAAHPQAPLKHAYSVPVAHNFARSSNYLREAERTLLW